MVDKEFVLVSQGIEIYRTKSQENAVNMVKKENDEWFDYKQRCIDNYEDYADNYIDLEIEYASDKERYEKLQRIEDYLDRHSDIPMEVLVNIKNIIHSEVEDEVI